MRQNKDIEFNIKALTNFDDQHWRVDWFGYLRYFDKNGVRRSEPLIDVYLSPFKKTPSSNSLNYKTSTVFEDPNRVQVPVSYLRLLRLGDVWHRGKRVALPHSESMLECFPNLDISGVTTQTLHAGAKSTHGNYVLPFPFHPYHGKATQTYCEVVTVGEDLLLVVPHYVILQAYFSSSQYVFQQLFKFGLQFDSIYDPAKSFINPDGSAFLHLKKWTHDAAASEVARMAFDPTAYQVVRMMSQHFAVQEVNAEPVRPKAAFPFKGKTNLEVYGKWCPLDFNDENRKAFVVYDILSCSASYPFSQLEYFRDNPGDKDPLGRSTHPSDRKTIGYQKPKPRVSTSSELEMHPGEEPSNKLDELETEARSGATFSDLTEKLVEKKRVQAHQSQVDNNAHQKVEDVSQGNTGEGESRGQVAPIDFQLPKSEYEGKFVFKEPVCRLALFQEVIKKLQQAPHVTKTEFIPIFEELGHHQGLYSFFPVTYTETGRKSTWQYINYFKGFTKSGKEQYCHRRALVAKLSLSSGDDILLAEAERRKFKVENGWVELDDTSVFLSITRSTESYTGYELARCLESSSEERGRWQPFPAGRSIKCLSVKHPQHTTIASGEYVDRQVAILERHIAVPTSH